MKKILALLMILVMVMGLFAACANKMASIEIEDKEEDSEETEETEETETTEETENTTEDTTVPEETENNGVRVYVATVVDENGNPMEGVMVQFCDENGCMPAMTDAEGKAQCQTLNEKTVKIMEMPDGYEYATSQEEWDFAEGEEVTIVLKTIETDPTDVYFFTVIVEDEDGNPMEGVMVLFCDENGCMPAMTDAEGKANCQTLNAKTVKIMEMPEGYTYATAQEEWDFTAGDEVTIVLKAV